MFTGCSQNSGRSANFDRIGGCGGVEEADLPLGQTDGEGGVAQDLTVYHCGDGLVGRRTFVRPYFYLHCAY